MSKEKLKIVIGKHGALKLCYLEDKDNIDLLDTLPHNQTLNFLDELVKCWNEYDGLVEALEAAYTMLLQTDWAGDRATDIVTLTLKRAKE